MFFIRCATEKGYQNRKRTAYSGTRVILLLDGTISVLASLLSLMLVRWVSDEIPGFSTMVLRWVAVSALSSLLGFFLFKTHRVVRRYASVRSLARIIGAILVKEAFLVIALVFGLVRLPGTASCVMAVLVDVILTATALFYVRMSARLISEMWGGVLMNLVLMRYANLR